jgi:translation initiation factor 5B
VPVAAVGLGPLHRKDVVQASVMLEKRKEFATMLCFDVKVTPEAEAAAEALGVKIFRADIIYHLTDQFTKYLAEQTKARQAAVAGEAVFPCILRVVPSAIFNKKDPIVLGVDVVEGKLRMGTPLCVVLPAGKEVTAGGLGAEREAAAAAAAGGGGSAVLRGSGKNVLVIGVVAGLEVNHAAVTEAAAGGPSVCVKIAQSGAQAGILYGRHFDHTYPVYAHVSRSSIDVLKEHFRAELTQPIMKTIVKLKEVLGVM